MIPVYNAIGLTHLKHHQQRSQESELKKFWQMQIQANEQMEISNNISNSRVTRSKFGIRNSIRNSRDVNIRIRNSIFFGLFGYWMNYSKFDIRIRKPWFLLLITLS